MLDRGKIIAIRGQIAEVFFPKAQPKAHDVLLLESDTSVKAEVVASASEANTYSCLVFDRADNLERGAYMINTGNTLQIPVGKAILGRVMNGFGNTVDGKEEIAFEIKKPIYGHAPEFEKIEAFRETIETGIKIIDFFCPILKGGKIGILGGAGVGKTVMLTEMMHQLMIQGSDKNIKSMNTVPIFAGVGERTRESQELITTLTESGMLPFSTVILGSMGEHAAARFLAAQSAVTIAEYFRDDLKSNVLFFMDNAFRFAQAGNELAMMMKSLPSEDGYQPTLFSELAQFHERLVSTSLNTLTTIEAVYIPNDDVLDQAVQAIFSYLDSAVVFSRDIYQQNLLPAVDVLASVSTALNPAIVGEDHYKAATDATALIRKAESLERIVALVGKSELSPEDRVIYERAKKLRNFMTQDLFVLEAQMGPQHPGKLVPCKDTIRGVKAIMAGELDNAELEQFLYIGGIGEIKA